MIAPESHRLPTRYESDSTQEAVAESAEQAGTACSQLLDSALQAAERAGEADSLQIALALLCGQ